MELGKSSESPNLRIKYTVDGEIWVEPDKSILLSCMTIENEFAVEVLANSLDSSEAGVCVLSAAVHMCKLLIREQGPGAILAIKNGSIGDYINKYVLGVMMSEIPLE